VRHDRLFCKTQDDEIDDKLVELLDAMMPAEFAAKRNAWLTLSLAS